MKYLIYCKKTHKLLAVYTNAKSLETLNTDKCYYKEQAEVKAAPTDKSRRTAVGRESGSRVGNDNSNDYMNPVNPIGFYASSHFISYSDCSSSSSSSDSSSNSSSSSCD